MHGVLRMTAFMQIFEYNYYRKQVELYHTQIVSGVSICGTPIYISELPEHNSIGRINVAIVYVETLHLR